MSLSLSVKLQITDSRSTAAIATQPQQTIQEYDATLLMEKNGPFPFKILVDQGEADKFLAGASSGWLID